MDYKGVFLPEASDILLGKFDQTIHQHTNNSGNKNTKDDIDIEFYSLDKFLKMLYQGQTVAWELLFTPDNMILEKHPLWDEIRASAPLFVNKKVDAFIGYCKQQAHKYGVRGSRLNTVRTVLEMLKRKHDYGTLASELSQREHRAILALDHVEELDKYMGERKFTLLSVCGKKFAYDTKLEYIIPALQKYYDEYGERSRQAERNEGVDWKALSHAVRVCMQAISLLIDGKINLPMHPSQVYLLKQIKAGELSFGEVSKHIEEYQELMLHMREASTLPEEPNLEAFQEVQKRIYAMVVKGEV